MMQDVAYKKSLLLSAYSDSQKSLDTIHDRMDKISQNYLLAIGAIYVFYFSIELNSRLIVLFAPVVLSLSARYQIQNMWMFAARLCASEALIEKKIFRKNYESLPAHKALISSYIYPNSLNVESLDSKFHNYCIKNSYLRVCDKDRLWDICFWLVLIASLSIAGFDYKASKHNDFRGSSVKEKCFSISDNTMICKTKEI